MATTHARVNPQLLTWARERARLTPAALAARLKVTAERLNAWERGERPLTFKQAQNIAAKTRVPFGYLYLKQPPRETLPLPDLRTVGGQHPDRPSPELIEMAQIVLRRQEWYAEYLRDQSIDRNANVGRFTVTTSIDDVVQDMRQVLGVAPHPERGTWEDYFRHLVTRIERAGAHLDRQKRCVRREPRDAKTGRGIL